MTLSTTNPPLPARRRSKTARSRLAADSGFVVIVSLVMAFLYTPIL